MAGGGFAGLETAFGLRHLPGVRVPGRHPGPQARSHARPTHPVYTPGAGRTGCLLMIDTRLNELIAIATQIAADISSSVSTSRASV